MSRALLSRIHLREIPSGKFVIGQLKGQICEVVLATGTVDQTNVDPLTAYLKARYAVP